MYKREPRYVAAEPIPCITIDSTVSHRFPPMELKGGIGPSRENPMVIKIFPMSIAIIPSNPLSVRTPNSGVKIVYAHPKAMNTSPVWEKLSPNSLVKKGPKEAEYQAHDDPAKESTKKLIRTPG